MENSKKKEIAVLGGGCFWCTEAVFRMLRGVSSVEPGYSGGTKDTPTYEDVCTGETKHVEVVRVEYDPSLISYRELLAIFFGSHDPTLMNRQGNDVGEQYRSVIFVTSDDQRREAEAFIEELNASSEFGERIVTVVEPLRNYYPAEEYNKDYYARNPYQPYCEIVINPKLEKVKQRFATLLIESSDQKK